MKIIFQHNVDERRCKIYRNIRFKLLLRLMASKYVLCGQNCYCLFAQYPQKHFEKKVCFYHFVFIRPIFLQKSYYIHELVWCIYFFVLKNHSNYQIQKFFEWLENSPAWYKLKIKFGFKVLNHFKILIIQFYLRLRWRSETCTLLRTTTALEYADFSIFTLLFWEPRKDFSMGMIWQSNIVMLANYYFYNMFNIRIKSG